jgi:hypothetical protein
MTDVAGSSKELADAFDRYVHSQGFVRLGAEKKRLLEQFADWLGASNEPRVDLPLSRAQRIERLSPEEFATIRAIADKTVAGSTFRKLLWQIEQLEAGIAELIAEPRAAQPPLPAPWHSYKNDPPSVDDALAGVAYAWEFHKGTWVIEVAIANRPMYDHEPELWARAADVLPCSTATKCEGRS